jgi:hypothetical protein
MMMKLNMIVVNPGMNCVFEKNDYFHYHNKMAEAAVVVVVMDLNLS